MTHVAAQGLKTALQLFESRFAMRKDVSLISAAPDEEVDFLWRFVIICLWAFCIYMRGYDTILRGCSPIALETAILLLRVILVDDEALMKRDEIMASASGGGCAHRVHSTLGAGVRNGGLQQKQKERIGPRTAFALELFVWFIVIILTIDLTNINRASVALFLANTLHWSRIGPKLLVLFIGIYVFATCFWCPAYSLRDTFLMLSGQGSWVYRVYSSFGMAFSLTLFLTETQCLQRVRRAGVWKVLMIPRVLEKSVANTPLSGLSSVLRGLADYFFFLGFNFCMALCMWFSSMMFEWTSEASFTGIICAFFVVSAILGEGWADDFQRMLRESVACLAMYLAVATLVVFCIPADTLPFAANGMSSAFFVLYMAAHSPRRVHSSLPLVMVWLGMLAVNAYWHVNRSGVNALQMTWNKKLLYVNTITSSSLFMTFTALYVYRWEWPVVSSAAAFGVVPNGVSRLASITRAEQKSREKSHNNTASSVSIALEKAATATFATTLLPGKRTSGGGDKAPSFTLSPSSASPSTSSSSSSSALRRVGNATPGASTGTGIGAVEPDKCAQARGEGTAAPSAGASEKLLTSLSDANTVSERQSCEGAHEPRASSTTSEQEEGEDVTAEETIDAKTTQDEDDGRRLPRLTASEEARPTTPPVKKELVQINAFEQEPPFVPLTSQTKRRSVNENAAPRFAAANSSSKVEPSSLSIALSSPLQMSSTASSEERRGGAAGKGKKTPRRVSPTRGENRKQHKSNERVAAVAVEKIQFSEKEPPSLQSVEKVAHTLPLRELKGTSAKAPPESATVVRNKAPVTASAVRRAASEKATNARKETTTKTALHKESAAVSHSQPPSRVPPAKAVCPEVTGPKGQAVRKALPRGEVAAAETKFQKPLPPHEKRAEDRRRATEAAAAAIIISSSASASHGGLAAHNEHLHEGNTVSSESTCVIIPQPRSAQTNLKTTSLCSLTVAAVKTLPREEQTWSKQRSSTKSEKDKCFSSKKNKCPSCVSSQGDDDASLDLGKLHLASLPESEAEGNSSRGLRVTPTFESSRYIPQATLHSLENFAKAYMPRVSASGNTDVERRAEVAKGKDAQSCLNVNSLRPIVENEGPPLGAIAPAAAGCSATTFPESVSAVPHQVTSQMFSMGVARDARSAALYQQANSAIRPQLTATPRMESHAVVMPQNPMQQQVPMMLVAMGDGRLTYCPVLASSYPTAPPIVMQPQPLESALMAQQHQQRGVLYHQQLPLSHPQPPYPGAWSHVNQQ
ncbi:uncharacterized protein Tco025E_09219 [Trypanosoma conorhini]|uniref:Transmembrane protein n=1 Tax=Trypanosoma conorhini TaxID=83891 RepID=A0A422MYZ7_9TRYP|nr:uncharacterized protein Tco025E_09219 [Trypanosoma conorhini]RNE98446.1 hypothetical protein Tco025E_09219 [Trypanosoma conorhini]